MAITEEQFKEVLRLIRTTEPEVRELISNNYKRQNLFPGVSSVTFSTLLNFLKEQNSLRKHVVSFANVLVTIICSIYEETGTAIPQEDPFLSSLCSLIDRVLRHGLRLKGNVWGTFRCYWDFIVEQAEHGRLGPLKSTVDKVKSITSLKGLGSARAWIRLSLRERTLSTALAVLLDNQVLIREWYEPHALVASTEFDVFSDTLAPLDYVSFAFSLQDKNLVKLNETEDGDTVANFVGWLNNEIEEISEKESMEYQEPAAPDLLSSPPISVSSEQVVPSPIPPVQQNDVCETVDIREYLKVIERNQCLEDACRDLEDKCAAQEQAANELAGDNEELMKKVNSLKRQCQQLEAKNAELQRTMKEFNKTGLTFPKPSPPRKHGSVRSIWGLDSDNGETSVERLNQAEAEIQEKTEKIRHFEQSYWNLRKIAEQLRDTASSTSSNLEKLHTQINQPDLCVFSKLKQLEEGNAEKDETLILMAQEMSRLQVRLNSLEHMAKDIQQQRPWQSNNLASKCNQCGQQFSLLLRKHHCRRDGKLYCARCSTHRILLPSSKSPVRVCDSCYETLTTAD
ncbi:FYVE-domain-containing protein [Basidiobolus meristosporus CBS 931.73]|uniref:FYVE-domain-containing protein n=1 Tax=Basidiobolus meristosporus CBS 931.73 TaxID=1314790 RepID=A0A1Y1Y6I5_9FUNG|nr:FYVE-domain-containing protein [Basidiobolus meristosporus CBS 931.73]|eukprot:ORX93603.1 FYVE-domain-containing protein [Basidiobolus meristosporus CBS 931.73]